MRISNINHSLYYRNNEKIKGNNKGNITNKPWNSRNIMSSQNLFGFNYMRKEEDNRMQGIGVITDINKKMIEDSYADNVARKVARGESITPEERAILMEIAPEKLEKAMEANKRRKEIESTLKSAKTKNEAEQIILQAKIEAQTAFEKYDQVYGEYLIEAVNKLEHDYYKNKKGKEGMEEALEEQISNKIDISV